APPPAGATTVSGTPTLRAGASATAPPWTHALPASSRSVWAPTGVAAGTVIVPVPSPSASAGTHASVSPPSTLTATLWPPVRPRPPRRTGRHTGPPGRPPAAAPPPGGPGPAATAAAAPALAARGAPGCPPVAVPVGTGTVAASVPSPRAVTGPPTTAPSSRTV